MSPRWLAVALAAWSMLAEAQLYRWKDPESGATRFSSYPPPWHGNAELERRSPKVEVLEPRQAAKSAEPPQATEKKSAAAPPAPAAQAPGATAAMEARFKQAADALSSALARGGPDLKTVLESFMHAAASLDLADPASAERRRGTVRSLVERAMGVLGVPPVPSPAAGGPAR